MKYSSEPDFCHASMIAHPLDYLNVCMLAFGCTISLSDVFLDDFCEWKTCKSKMTDTHCCKVKVYLCFIQKSLDTCGYYTSYSIYKMGFLNVFIVLKLLLHPSLFYTKNIITKNRSIFLLKKS